MAIFEKYESRTEKISASGINAQRVFISDWATRHADAPKIGDPYPDLLGVFCSDVQMAPLGESTAAGPAKCLITANYSSSDRAQQQDEEFEAESLDFGGEVIAKGGGKWESLTKDSDGKMVQAKVAENDPGAVTYYPRCEYVKEIVIDDITGWAKKIYKATGKLNSSTHLGGGKETWLFQGANAVKFTDQDGQTKWRLIFRFIYRDTGWQESWRVDDPKVGGKWDRIVFIDDDGKESYRYKTTSFTTLLSG